MWQVKCAVNTAKALLPFQDGLRSLKRRLDPPRLGPQHQSVLSGGFDHIEALRAGGLDLRGSHVLELGSGWFPIIPFMLRIAGAERIYLTDVHRLLDATTLRAAAGYVEDHRAEIAERLGVGASRVEAVVAAAKDDGPLQGLLDRLGFVYIAPFDPATQMPKVDAIISQTVFEHIPPDVLETLLVDLKSGLKPDGLMSHGIDNTDHRAVGDHRLATFDFLRYDERVWKLFCINPQDYTNRLRHSDYMDLFDKTGYTPSAHAAYVNRRALKTIGDMRVSPALRGKTPEDLVTGWSHVVARNANERDGPRTVANDAVSRTQSRDGSPRPA